MSAGYVLKVGPVEYVGTKGGEEPFTLPDCWRLAEGCGGVTILSPTGRVVLERAGEQVGRRERVRALRRAQRARMAAGRTSQGD